MTDYNPGQELSSIDFAALIGGPLVAAVNAQAQAAMSSVNFIKAVGFKSGSSENPEAPDTGEPIYVTFKYPKEVAPYQPAVDAVAAVEQIGDPLYPKGMKPHAEAAPDAPDNDGEPTHAGGFPVYVAPVAAVPAVPAKSAQIQIMKLEVPILTMLPIPFLRIEEVTIDFNAKINSMQYSNTADSLKVKASAKGGVKYPPIFSVVSAKLKTSTSYQRTSRQGNTIKKTFSLAVHTIAKQDEMPAGMEKVFGILEDSMRSQPVKAIEPNRDY